jgi:hypothetical protein
MAPFPRERMPRLRFALHQKRTRTLTPGAADLLILKRKTSPCKFVTAVRGKAVDSHEF